MTLIRLDPKRCTYQLGFDFEWNTSPPDWLPSERSFVRVGRGTNQIGFFKGFYSDLVDMNPLFDMSSMSSAFQCLHTLHSDFLNKHNLFIAPEDMPQPVDPIELPPDVL